MAGSTAGGMCSSFPGGVSVPCVAVDGLTRSDGFRRGIWPWTLSARGVKGISELLMAPKSNGAAAAVEDKRLDRLPETAKAAVKKVDWPSLQAGKERVGRAVRAGVGDDPIRVYADEGQMSRVMGGPGIPDYMGRLANNPEALRRYALALLEGDEDVSITTTVTLRRRA
jgi:hypothetical protein